MLTSSKGNYFILQKKETEASFFHHVKFILFFGFMIGLFHQINNRFERLRIVHCEVGEGFAVKFNSLLS